MFFTLNVLGEELFFPNLKSKKKNTYREEMGVIISVQVFVATARAYKLQELRNPRTKVLNLFHLTAQNFPLAGLLGHEKEILWCQRLHKEK